MYGILFERQSDWENSTDAKSLFLTYALELGLDKDKFHSDYDRKDFEEIINNSYRSGVKAGVQGTPTFFINGKMITNPQSYDEFKEIIKNATTKSSIQ
jgi:protein-disulfide isomerase